MTREELLQQIKEKRSFLCVGLDTDMHKLPPHLVNSEGPFLDFNKAIIEATAPFCIAYKPNLAFYEAMGAYGMYIFEQTVNFIRENYPSLFIIADAKRGDIGNTGNQYARAFFEHFRVDALTVAPYMGGDSVQPFMDYSDKWTILLALTSNPGAEDLQLMKDAEGRYFFEHVIEKSLNWTDHPENLIFVVGATKTEYLSKVRQLAPHNFLLVPGIGAQGGDFEQLVAQGMTSDCGLIVNSSRGIIYADNSKNFASAAAKEAHRLQSQMELALRNKGIID